LEIPYTICKELQANDENSQSPHYTFTPQTVYTYKIGNVYKFI